MKEKIYTIPINEAFDENCTCPMCLIEKRMESEAVEYELGPAMMEPDHRIITNEKGFCRNHWEKLFAVPKKLPLALVADTHLEEVCKKLELLKKGKQGGLFGKNKQSFGENIDSCAICDKVDKTMERYCDVLVKMWDDEEEFREKFQKSNGFCLKHFNRLYSISNSKKFSEALLEKETEELGKLQEDIHKFTLMFDYRSNGADWGTAKDAPIRCIEKLAGYIDK